MAIRRRGYRGGMPRLLPPLLVLALVAAVPVVGAGCGGGSDSPEGSLEVTVTPARFACVRQVTNQTVRTCTAQTAAASLTCSPDEISYSLPDGMREPDVDAGEVCERVDDERLLSPETGGSCARPRGRVVAVGELDGEGVRLALRSCPDDEPADDEAAEWARLVGLPFAGLPGR